MPPIENTQLQLKQVSLAASMGSSYILKDITFNAFESERIAIIGPSGAGKTSLLRLLNRLSEPTSGSLYFENQDYQKIPVLKLRQEVTLVPQESKLLGMTVREALAYPLVLRHLPPQEIQQRLLQSTAMLHVPEDWLGRTEVQLSVGQRQLVAITRALVIQPKVLLLDEPTSALDAGRASHLMEVLTQLATTGKTTIFMVNHQLELAQLFSTRVLYIQQGQLLEDAPNSPTLDWVQLRQNIMQTEAQVAEEWQ